MLDSRLWMFLEPLVTLKLASREVIILYNAPGGNERTLPHSLINTERLFFIIAHHVSGKWYGTDFYNLPPYLLVLFRIEFVLIHYNLRIDRPTVFCCCSFGCVGSLLQCAGFSVRWLLLLQSMGSRCTGFSSCGSQALEHRLSSCSAWA